MLQVISSAWALLLGMGLLMVGNGMQSTLLGVRGQIENFGTFEMSVVISAYFIGFLGGSRMGAKPDPQGWARSGLCSIGLPDFGGDDPVSHPC